MGTIIATLIRTLGLPTLAVLGLLAFYEGIPGAHRIPFLSSIPVIGDLATGRVHAYAFDQVRAEKARCVARVEQMVTQAEFKALQARFDRERHLRELAQKLNELAAVKATEAINARDAALADVERRIAEDTGEGGRWSEEDEIWRRQ